MAAETVNVWLALSTQALDVFKARRQAERNEEVYTGPMPDRIYKGLSRMADMDTVQRLFQTPTLGGTEYNLFSVYFKEGQLKAKGFLDDMIADYPSHFIVLGAWWWDGRQVGTQWELDGQGEPTGNVTGTPLYPLPAQAYRVMPDIVTYDENGTEVSRVPASSNADLRDINLLSGQTPRRFI